MKLLFASDSFKGSLSSEKTIELLSRAAEEVFGECEVVGLPVADGGEGTVDAVIRAEAGYTISVPVHDPLMSIVDASYGVFDDTKAIIEMSAASGLTLVPEELRNPWETTSYGTGELIRHALESGYREIYIAIGGSAGGRGCNRRIFPVGQWKDSVWFAASADGNACANGDAYSNSDTYAYPDAYAYADARPASDFSAQA